MTAPIVRRRLGHLSVSVFGSERSESGTPLQSISIARRYFDRSDEEWKTTSVSLNPADLPAVGVLLQNVQKWLIEQNQEPTGSSAAE